MYYDMENDLIRAWQLLLDLSDLNAHNQKVAAGLNNIAAGLKVRQRFCWMSYHDYNINSSEFV